ncbi:Clp protease (nucleomorph) [Bigelowiella natans]|uniref:Clp protease n=1 Tax=Bigelowiella natans TaxID=227086 RepID=Q3LVU8_BIGNA|nr:Clp protease [Bigelowiella natans]ABA27417.1 Clp protease [Bigelowiella natans]
MIRTSFILKVPKKYNCINKYFKNKRIGKNTKKFYDISSKIYEKNIIFIGQPINTFIVQLLISQVIFLFMNRKNEKNRIFINTPYQTKNNFLYTSDLYLYNFLQTIRFEYSSYNIGLCNYDIGLILSSGIKSNRYGLKNSIVLFTETEINSKRISNKKDTVTFWKDLLYKQNLIIYNISKETQLKPETIKKVSFNQVVLSKETIN